MKNMKKMIFVTVLVMLFVVTGCCTFGRIQKKDLFKGYDPEDVAVYETAAKALAKGKEPLLWVKFSEERIQRAFERAFSEDGIRTDWVIDFVSLVYISKGKASLAMFYKAYQGKNKPKEVFAHLSLGDMSQRVRIIPDPRRPISFYYPPCEYP